MPISAEKVRDLAALGEGPTIDFKRDPYDSTRAGINAELAKDLMAIGNELRIGGPNGYILIGVEDDGPIVGIAPTAHADDGDLHRRVTNILNATPRFSYSVTDVDSMSIGVIEIEPGGRPFFPVRDSPPLRRRVPIHRNGSVADEASPLHVLAWAKEDDPRAARLSILEIEEREAERRIHASCNPRDLKCGWSDYPVACILRVRNRGRWPFTMHQLRWRMEWRSSFYEAMQEELEDVQPREPSAHAYWRRGEQPPDYTPPNGTWALALNGLPAAVAPNGEPEIIRWHWRAQEAAAHFAEHKLPLKNVGEGWVRLYFEVDLVSEFGTQRTLTCEIE